MSSGIEIDPTISINTVKLTEWMDAEGLEVGAPVEVGYISGGSQNDIYEVTRGDIHAALRMPPLTAPAARDEGIMREWRIIDALRGSDIPHTPAIAACSDQSVLGRAFYLMGFVDGWSPMTTMGKWPEPFASDTEARTGLAYQLIEGAALMANFDWRGNGLEGLGRPDGFHERQVDRWTEYLNRVKGRELPGFDETATWLRAHKPIDFIPGLMHGDYQFANVMYEDGAPAKLGAIVDWEMGTVGDPKLDLAWVVHSWPEDTSSGEGTVGGYVDMSHLPSRTQVLQHYVDVSGRQVDDIDYYCVLAKWKLGVMLEQSFQRAGTNPKLDAFGPFVLDLIQGAADLAASSDYQGR